MRVTIVGALATMVLSGVLENFNQLLGRDRHRILTAEEVSLADSVRARIPPRAVLAVGLRHNHPVTLLTGRRVLLGFPGWMWSQGLDYGDRERALSAMFALSPEAPRLFRRYGVDYVVIGPDERERSTVNLAAYHARFPRLLRTQSYEIFAVCRGAPCHLEAAAPRGETRDYPADIRRSWSQRCEETAESHVCAQCTRLTATSRTATAELRRIANRLMPYRRERRCANICANFPCASCTVTLESRENVTKCAWEGCHSA